ncbi:MAG: ABC transporter ATP-binding protein [Saprospiraceae bacterium]|nr:ABC transporter ATP-binding protein [Saprospiraceae bacterium]
MPKILDVKNLSVHFASPQGHTQAVDRVSFHLDQGETLGIVGESGSGKSVTALSIMRLLPSPPAGISSEAITLYPRDGGSKEIEISTLGESEMQRLRGAEIAMIFQEPMTSLNPVFRCGDQVTEAIRLHQKVDAEAARKQTLLLFEKVRLPDPERIFRSYPHQISGGQKQRVMIAMAMSCKPGILIADEPTTALDVTVQKAILDLMRELKEESGLSMLFISHDLGVISDICDRVLVMYQGKIVEEGPVQKILSNPEHPYTRGLVACRPSLKHKWHRMPTVSDFLDNSRHEARVVSADETEQRRKHLYDASPLLQVKDMLVRFPAEKNWLGRPVKWLNAVDRVSFDVFQGETFGLAGESGCGKTTLGKAIARLTDMDSGQIIYNGTALHDLSIEAFKPYRRDIQVVFQDPYSSLNPRMAIGRAIMEPMQVHKRFDSDKQRREKAVELLETVGLQADQFQRYPHEFSGGQRQRICIARALALEPRFLVCDEIVSALDVSVQATVLNLLADLQEKYGLTYLFISHDLSVIKQMCDRLLVMNKGKVEAVGYPEDIFRNPEREYVRELIAAIPGKE